MCTLHPFIAQYMRAPCLERRITKMMSKQLTSLNILGLYLHLGSVEGYYITCPNLWLSKPMSTSYELLVSYTPLRIPHGYPTTSPLTKNKALFASALTFVISIMLVPKTNFQCLPSTKLSMTMQNTRPCPSWMGSLSTIKSKSIQRISIKPHLLPCGVLFHIMSCLLDSKMQALCSNGP
jgi:hypothetical protein